MQQSNKHADATMALPTTRQKRKAATLQQTHASTPISALQRIGRNAIKNELAVRINAAKRGGRAPRGFLSGLIEEEQTKAGDGSLYWLTEDVIRSHCKRLGNKRHHDAGGNQHDAKIMRRGNVSFTHNSASSRVQTTRSDDVSPRISLASGATTLGVNNRQSANGQQSALLLPPSNVGDDSNPQQEGPRNKGGSPKDTANEQDHEYQLKLTRAANIAVANYHKLREDCKKRSTTRKKRQAPTGSLKRIIQEALQEVGLPPDCDVIRPETVRRRVDRGNVTPQHRFGRGSVSPMLALEPQLVLLLRSKVQATGIPLKPARVLTLANDLIRGTATEKKVIAYKARVCGSDPNAEEANLGAKYYQNFMKRNGHLLGPKPLERLL